MASRPTRQQASWRAIRLRADNGSGDFAEYTFPLAGGGRGTCLLDVALTRAQLLVALAREGAVLPADHEARLQLADNLIASIPTDRVGILASKTGWHGERFLLGGEVIGSGDVPLRLMRTTMQAGQGIGQRSGTLDSWQAQVAAPAESSPFASFAIMVGLAGPLLRYAGLPESIFFNFVGASASGKTTALLAGASVLGSPIEPFDWNATDRALCERAAASSDLMMVVDDMERFRPGSGGRIPSLSNRIHILTSGSSAAYASIAAAGLPNLSWRSMLMTSSPRTLREEFAAARLVPTGGDESRWVDVPVPGPAEGGIWEETLDGDAAGNSDRLRIAAEGNYGTAIRKWVRILQRRSESIEAHVQRKMAIFLRNVAPDASGVSLRIANKFAVVYAAGRLATIWGLLPWQRGHAYHVARSLLRGGIAETQAHQRAVESNIQAFLVAITDRTLFPVVANGVRPTLSTDPGFRGFARQSNNRAYVYFSRTCFDAHFGMTALDLFAALNELGAIVGGHGRRTGQVVRLADGHSARLVSVDVEIALGRRS